MYLIKDLDPELFTWISTKPYMNKKPCTIVEIWAW